MVGYILWTTDRLTARPRIRTTDAIASRALVPRLAACSKIVMSAAMGHAADDALKPTAYRTRHVEAAIGAPDPAGFPSHQVPQ